MDKILAKGREYYSKNRDRILQQRKDIYIANKDEEAFNIFKKLKINKLIKFYKKGFKEIFIL